MKRSSATRQNCILTFVSSPQCSRGYVRCVLFRDRIDGEMYIGPKRPLAPLNRTNTCVASWVNKERDSPRVRASKSNFQPRGLSSSLRQTLSLDSSVAAGWSRWLISGRCWAHYYYVMQISMLSWVVPLRVATLTWGPNVVERTVIYRLSMWINLKPAYRPPVVNKYDRCINSSSRKAPSGGHETNQVTEKKWLRIYCRYNLCFLPFGCRSAIDALLVAHSNSVRTNNLKDVTDPLRPCCANAG